MKSDDRIEVSLKSLVDLIGIAHSVGLEYSPIFGNSVFEDNENYSEYNAKIFADMLRKSGISIEDYSDGLIL